MDATTELIAINPIFLAVTTVILSGITAALVSSHLLKRKDERELKRDVLRRFVGNRYFLTAGRQSKSGEPFIALNEIFVVYARDREVIDAIKKMHEEIRTENRLIDNILTLTKAMAKAAKIPISGLNDNFIEAPFTPQSNSG